MNERIRELWDQAAKVIDSDRDPYSWESQTRFMEQFANLIVAECIDAVENSNDRYRRDYFAEKIRERFGVKQ
jgi:hypothetical protein